MTEQRVMWTDGQLEKRTGTDRRVGERRGRGAKAKVYNAEKKIWEFPRNEESVLDEIRYRMQSAGSKVFRVRERIPKTTCPRCRGPVWVGKHSDSGHPDLHGFFPADTWNRLLLKRGAEQMSLSKLANYPVQWFCEVKREKGGVKRQSQTAVIEEIERLGGMASFANSWEAWCTYLETKTGVVLPRT